MILCAGSIGFDTTRTPFATAERVLGGAATYFTAAARFYSPVGVVGAVGDDFPEKYWKFFSQPNVDGRGIQKISGEKTFHFDSTFSYDFNSRTANKTEENCLAKFRPIVPPEFSSKARIVYLATMQPENQLRVLEQLEGERLVILDTIEYYVKNSLAALKKAVSRADVLVLNDAEARMLAQTHNLIAAGKLLEKMGPRVVAIKKGEHGSLLFFENKVFPFPAFPLEKVVDPTGAGDCFAGGFTGFLAPKSVGSPAGGSGGEGGRGGELDERVLRSAMAHGTVMASFAVEEFSVRRLEKLSWKEIEARLAEYKALLGFAEAAPG